MLSISSAVVNAKVPSDCNSLERIFNTEVEEKNGNCTVEIQRKNLDVVHMGKKQSPETMELVFHFTFEKVDSKTAVMGEFAMLEEEVNPVIDAFRKGRMDISAVHNHMMI
jgi:hypothetical protein